jgi:hypothetical protein
MVEFHHFAKTMEYRTDDLQAHGSLCSNSNPQNKSGTMQNIPGKLEQRILIKQGPRDSPRSRSCLPRRIYRPRLASWGSEEVAWRYALTQGDQPVNLRSSERTMPSSGIDGALGMIR